MNVDYINKKFKRLSILAMIMVVFIHSIAILNVEQPELWVSILQWGICRSFTDMAVPFFFLMSGYWFYKKIPKNFLTVWRTKIRTLVVPYILWSVIGACSIMPLVCLSNIIGNRPLFERTILSGDSIYAILDALFGITIYGPVGAEPLWFVRALIICFFFAPLWMFLIRYRIGRCILIGITISHIVYMYPYLKVIAMFPSSIGWFVGGILVGVYRLERCRISTCIFSAAFILMISGCILKILQCCEVANWYFPVLRSLIPVGGILFVWGLYDRLKFIQNIEIPNIVNETFWVYCCHQIIGGYVMALLLTLLGKAGWALMVTTFIAIGFQVFGSYLLAYAIKMRLPKFFNLLTGGRGKLK